MKENVFQRVEKKYLLDLQQYHQLLRCLNKKLCKDKYFSYTICNIYFDTSDYHLISTSLEKPHYKEKVRLRSYGVPHLDDRVFLEIKKKYRGVVGKRRVTMSLAEAYQYLSNKKMPVKSQIMKEIDYCFQYYNLIPVLYLAYDRYAYYIKGDKDFRITFDYNIRSRNYDLYLENGDYGVDLLEKNQFIMEVKVNGSIPLWFSHLLAELKIYPVSFSKYGNVYMKNKTKELLTCLPVY